MNVQFDRWLATSIATTLRLAPTRVATTCGVTSGGVCNPSEAFSEAANLVRSRYVYVEEYERREIEVRQGESRHTVMHSTCTQSSKTTQM